MRCTATRPRRTRRLTCAFVRGRCVVHGAPRLPCGRCVARAFTGRAAPRSSQSARWLQPLPGRAAASCALAWGLSALTVPGCAEPSLMRRPPPGSLAAARRWPASARSVVSAVLRGHLPVARAAAAAARAADAAARRRRCTLASAVLVLRLRRHDPAARRSHAPPAEDARCRPSSTTTRWCARCASRWCWWSGPTARRAASSASASHDLRQPMHALGLFAATLDKRLHGTALTAHCDAT